MWISQILFSVLLFHHYTHSSVSSCSQYSPSSSFHKSFLLLLTSYKIIFLDPIHPPLQLLIFPPSSSINFFHFFLQPYVRFPSLQPNPSPSFSSFSQFPLAFCLLSIHYLCFICLMAICMYTHIFVCSIPAKIKLQKKDSVLQRSVLWWACWQILTLTHSASKQPAVASSLDCLRQFPWHYTWSNKGRRREETQFWIVPLHMTQTLWVTTLCHL